MDTALAMVLILLVGGAACFFLPLIISKIFEMISNRRSR